MIDKSLSDLVHSYVNFPQGTNPSGWSKCYCEVCGDGRRIKGPRGGWSFEGDMAFYHCFNCGIDGNFDPDREFPFSKDMRSILDGFGVPQKEYNAIAYRNKVSSDKTDKKPEKKPNQLTFYPLPSHFYPLKDAPLTNTVAGEARRWLIERYALTQDSYDFYLSTGIVEDDADVRKKAHAKSLAGRLIIPFMKNGKMIYYQGRATNDINPKRYLNMDVPKTNVIFNMDALYKNRDRTLYVLEGVFDALHVDGVAVLENHMTSNQIELLEKSPRRKVIIPDRRGDSSRLIEQAIELGWGISRPEIGSGSKDICEGILKYGKLHVLNSIVNKTYYGKEAKMMANFG